MNHSSHMKLILAGAAALVVLAAFGVPVLAYVPLLAIFVLCPLMMVMMMRGMDHGGASDRDDLPGDRASSGHRH